MTKRKKKTSLYIDPDLIDISEIDLSRCKEVIIVGQNSLNTDGISYSAPNIAQENTKDKLLMKMLQNGLSVPEMANRLNIEPYEIFDLLKEFWGQEMTLKKALSKFGGLEKYRQRDAASRNLYLCECGSELEEFGKSFRCPKCRSLYKFRFGKLEKQRYGFSLEENIE